MFCNSCGKELPGDTRFCAVCGTPSAENAAGLTPVLSEPPVIPAVHVRPSAALRVFIPPPMPDGYKVAPKVAAINAVILQSAQARGKRGGKLSIRKLLLAGLAVLVLILLFAHILHSPAYTQSKGSVYTVYAGGEIVVFTAKGKRSVIDGALAASYPSLDGTAKAILADTGGEAYTLYHVDSKLTKVSEEVWDCVISLSGGAVAYIKNAYDGQGDLYLYRNGKSERIAADINVNRGYCVSPDGKTLAYTKDAGERFYGYVWTGKERELGKNIAPQYIANGAKYVYYDKNGKLFVQKGNKADSAAGLGKAWGNVLFNKDMTRMIYTSEGKTLYYQGKDGKKSILNTIVTDLVIPDGTAFVRQQNAVVYGISDFTDKLLVTASGEAVYRLDNKAVTQSIVKNISYAALGDNGKTLIFMRNNKVYTIKIKKENALEERLLQEDYVPWLLALNSGKTLYYLNEDRELYCQKGKGKPVMVSDDDAVSSAVHLLNNDRLLYISEGELYRSDGKAGKPVRNVSGTVLWLETDYFSITVCCEDDGSYVYYRSANGVSFDVVGSW